MVKKPRLMLTEEKIIRKLIEENKNFTIRELAQAIKADYKITHTAAQRLIQRKILECKTIGKSSWCNLNPKYSGPEIYYVESQRKMTILNKNRNLHQIFKELMNKVDTGSFIWLLFGSQAKGTADKYSDYDFMFISNEKDFEQKISGILSLIPLKLHILVFTEQEFKRMKGSKEPNVVTETIVHNVILYGIEHYYFLKNAR